MSPKAPVPTALVPAGGPSASVDLGGMMFRRGSANDEVLRNAIDDRLATTREPGWLAAFVRRAWPIIDPKPLVWNWHLTLICLELERVAAGLTRELVISLSPGFGKSIICSALFPAALWLREPGCKVLNMSHMPKNVTRDARRHRTVVQSTWYRGLVGRLARTEGIGLDHTGTPWALSREQNEKINFENTAYGSHEIGTVNGGITGTRVRGLIVDDPYDASIADSGSPASIAEAFAYVVDEYDSNWLSRIDPEDGWRITIMQGLGEGDLGDVLVKRGVRRVVLPMEFDPDAKVSIPQPSGEPREEPLGHPRDPRKVAGELMFPARYSRETADAYKRTAAGIRTWGPQYQQRRARLGGRLFPRDWFSIPFTPGIGVQRYMGPPLVLGKSLDNIAISVDCTFKDGKGSDKVAVHAWGWNNANKAARFLLDRVCDQMDILATISAVANMRARWNALTPGTAKVRVVIIEEAGNGDAVIALFRKGGAPNVIGYKPRTHKTTRAKITTYAMQAGNVYYPMPDEVPWMAELVEEHVAFTGEEGGFDDDIDAESQMMIWLDDDDAKMPSDVIERMRAQMGALKGRR